MAEREIVVYGTVWCGDCRRVRAYLDGKQIPYRYVDIDEDRHAAAYVMSVNRGYRSVPTIVFPDGSLLVEPNLRELAQRTSALSFDLAVVYRRSTCVGCERRKPGEKSCGECMRLERLLEALDVPYRAVNVDQDEQARLLLARMADGAVTLPTLVFADGSRLVAPTLRELAEKLEPRTGTGAESGGS